MASSTLVDAPGNPVTATAKSCIELLDQLGLVTQPAGTYLGHTTSANWSDLRISLRLWIHDFNTVLASSNSLSQTTVHFVVPGIEEELQQLEENLQESKYWFPIAKSGSCMIG